jgi:hypothetical protein
MKIRKILPILVAGALMAVGAVGVIAFKTVYAQSTTPTPTTPTTPQQGMPGKGNWGGMRGGKADLRGGGYSETDLASALGITVEQLQAAEKTANDEALKQAVADGLITQAQADQLSANGMGIGHFGEFGKFAASGIDYNALLAKALNITTDQLTAAQQKAYFANIDAAVTAGTLTQAQADQIKGQYLLNNNSDFKSSMTSAFEAAVQKAVSAGVITQAQADAILKSEQANGGLFGGRGGFGGMMHGFGGERHGRHGGFFNGGQQQTTPAQPSTTPSGNGL